MYFHSLSDDNNPFFKKKKKMKLRKEHAHWQRVCEANISETIVASPEGLEPERLRSQGRTTLGTRAPVSGLSCQPAQFLSEAANP